MQRLIERWRVMDLRRSSAAGSRFLTLVGEGRGLKPSARAAGVGRTTGYRWLREAFVELRAAGVGIAEAQRQLGFASPVVLEWERARVAAGLDARHHLAVDQGVEDVFWARFEGGAKLDDARRAAGVGRSTAYRWWRRRFDELRGHGLTVRAAAARLRMAPAQADAGRLTSAYAPRSSSRR
jgi:transposase-like protein